MNHSAPKACENNRRAINADLRLDEDLQAVKKLDIEQFIQSILASLPTDGQTIQAEVKENLRIAVEASLTRMNIVSREEFDAQTDLLQRTRIKLAELEKELSTLQETRSS
ncbi:MAG: accessory factor UbiK family protein [Gammaproteobacteria bacterium]